MDLSSNKTGVFIRGRDTRSIPIEKEGHTEDIAKNKQTKTKKGNLDNRGLTGNQLAGTLNFKPSELWDSVVYRHSDCGILLWQPEQIKTNVCRDQTNNRNHWNAWVGWCRTIGNCAIHEKVVIVCKPLKFCKINSALWDLRVYITKIGTFNALFLRNNKFKIHQIANLISYDMFIQQNKKAISIKWIYM